MILHFLKRLICLALILITLILTGCDKKNKESTNATTLLPPTPTLGTAASGNITSVITGTSETITLANIATINVSAGSLLTGQQVTVSATSNQATALVFDHATFIFDVVARQPYEIRINLGTSASPTIPLKLTVNLPISFTSALPADAIIVAFGQTDIDDNINGFDAIFSTFDSALHTLSLDLSPDFFSQNNSGNGTYEAVIIIGYINDIRTMKSPAKLAPWYAKALHYPVGPLDVWLNSPITTKRTVASYNGACSTGRLNVDGHYGEPRPHNSVGYHRGVDFKTTDGEGIIAAADGTIKWRRLEGYGDTAIITHVDGSKTLYAHLLSQGTMTQVKKGGKFAEAGISDNERCGGQNPHLHFEWIPFPVNALNVSGRIDPLPHIQNLSNIIHDPHGVANTSVVLSGQSSTVQLSAMGTTAFFPTPEVVINEDKDGVPIPVQDITWSSVDDTIASVDPKTGVVTAVSCGTTTIKAEQKSSDLNVNVATISVSCNASGIKILDAFCTLDTPTTYRVNWHGVACAPNGITLQGWSVPNNGQGGSTKYGIVCSTWPGSLNGYNMGQCINNTGGPSQTEFWGFNTVSFRPYAAQGVLYEGIVGYGTINNIIFSAEYYVNCP